MTELAVHEAGPMVTVQDLGRPGLQHAGVSRAGPMDVPSFRIANALVGNGPAAAGLEFAGVGGRFEATEPVRIAVTGGAVDVRIDRTPIWLWESHVLRPGSMLTIGAMRDAVWAYLAISGGIDTPPVLGSRSTHLRSGLGGHEGRRLVAGDRLPLGQAEPAPLLALNRPVWRSNRPIRVVKGPQDGRFSPEILRRFLGEPYIVSASRDRMAQVLAGPPLPAAGGHDIVSDGTALGSIQVPGSGQPIVLMAERQTTGGYPKIATLASVDVARLAQTPSGRPVRFAAISQSRAEDLAIEERQVLDEIVAGLAEKPAGDSRQRERRP
ncbi:MULTISPECIES: biotin-dependent carboxyltransferase family protein [unclassified Aureimonas]|uniref:5-oxoprolinase subunit C family protein n=1 Tax=unclassified Aureimonas TaxID=2615206 RepID=UPI0006F914E9|nr:MULTISPECIES: biotin-dependent carboxyltransferase family protein [unclassified Aureimonas]KQT64040.1 allophanate hydrolase [Aureimonas sp. Leaf427]KQT81233.1 allophanate hydrolase [Aureimonas sp. Leaf460]